MNFQEHDNTDLDEKLPVDYNESEEASFSITDLDDAGAAKDTTIRKCVIIAISAIIVCFCAYLILYFINHRPIDGKKKEQHTEMNDNKVKKVDAIDDSDDSNKKDEEEEKDSETATGDSSWILNANQNTTKSAGKKAVSKKDIPKDEALESKIEKEQEEAEEGYSIDTSGAYEDTGD